MLVFSLCLWFGKWVSFMFYQMIFLNPPLPAYSINWMQSITVPSILSPKPHILPTTATCTLSLAGTCFILVAKPTGSRASTASLLGKVPPYVCSLVTIAAPTRSTRSSRYISLVTSKANSSFDRLSFQFSAANDWNELQKSLKLETLISLTNFKHQLSEQLTYHCTCT